MTRLLLRNARRVVNGVACAIAYGGRLLGTKHWSPGDSCHYYWALLCQSKAVRWTAAAAASVTKFIGTSKGSHTRSGF